MLTWAVVYLLRRPDIDMPVLVFLAAMGGDCFIVATLFGAFR
jgi:hypothetical protein